MIASFATEKQKISLIQKLGTYHACTVCGFISKGKKDYVSIDDEFAVYETHQNVIGDPTYEAFFETFLKKAVFPYVNEGKEAFDFGSGPSPVLASFMERTYGYSCTLYDKFYAPDKVYIGKKYDVITATEVIEHIINPLDLFFEFKTLMKEDSILAVMTLFLPKEDSEFLGWHYMRDKTHVSFFTPQAMSIIAEKVGFNVLFCDNHRYTTFKIKS